MSRLSQARIVSIQTEVLGWYEQHKRTLPWRGITDPYRILVSEIMLQQTQVSRVRPKYEAFVTEFPTLEALAAASPAAVIRAWQGLGYNRRALNLQQTARVIRDEYAGQFPATVDRLQTLPGIGRYTAGALATFAFGVIEPAVDTNVKQFIDSVLPTRKPRAENAYYALAHQLIPIQRPVDWLHAVMDFVALQPDRFPKKKRRTSKPAEQFIGSTRYLRGRIIDSLRASAQTQTALYEQIAAPLDVDRQRFNEIIANLCRDGMIEKRNDRYQLPE